ncbi:MAG TPA: hypothetical protein VEB20_04100, partial [Azospirillaceae bacterium]|nr:hypothetical protein [Azospirillaceae bacterium]
MLKWLFPRPRGIGRSVAAVAGGAMLLAAAAAQAQPAQEEPIVDSVRPAARPMPAQPPTPDSTAMYCLPLCWKVLT